MRPRARCKSAVAFLLRQAKDGRPGLQPDPFQTSPSKDWAACSELVPALGLQNKCSTFCSCAWCQGPDGSSDRFSSLGAPVGGTAELLGACFHQRAGLLRHPVGRSPSDRANPPVGWGRQCPVLRDRCSAVRHCPSENRLEGPWWVSSFCCHDSFALISGWAEIILKVRSNQRIKNVSGSFCLWVQTPSLAALSGQDLRCRCGSCRVATSQQVFPRDIRISREFWQRKVLDLLS